VTHILQIQFWLLVVFDRYQQTSADYLHPCGCHISLILSVVDSCSVDDCCCCV